MKLLALLCAGSAWASIIGVSVTNTSDADRSYSGADRVFEFRSANGGTTAVNQTGNTYSFTNRFSWMAAFQVPAGGATVANVMFENVGYDLTFTVQDPGSAGYTLNFSTQTLGYNTAIYESGPSIVTASGPSFVHYLDSGSGFTFMPTFSTAGTLTNASSSQPTQNVLINQADAETYGAFSGTRTFTLRADYRPSPSLALFLQNNTIGSAASRFGLTGNLGIPAAATPGLDGMPAADMGNFMTVSVTMNSTGATVPEPSAWMLGAAGLAAVWMARRRTTSR